MKHIFFLVLFLLSSKVFSALPYGNEGDPVPEIPTYENFIFKNIDLTNASVKEPVININGFQHENHNVRTVTEEKPMFRISSSTDIIYADSSHYEYITVGAPFPMEPIKIFQFPKRDFVITDYGAKEGGEFDNTKAFAATINACNQAGGGRVVVPVGSWFTGPIHFKSNVNLHLEEGAILIFSDNPADYLPEVKSSLEGMEIYNYSPLIYAYECENIAITGKGLIQPKMDKWREWFPRGEAYMKAATELYTMMSTQVPVEQRRMAYEGNTMRPCLIHFNRCKTILLDGFTIRESPFWCIHLFLCDGGVVRRVDVKAHGHNNDGIDLEMSRNFLVEECRFDQGDDAVVIKSGSNQDGWRLNSPCENIVIRNCTILEGHTLLALGSELSSGICNIYMHDCTAPETVPRFLYIKTNHRRGGFVENIYMENLKSGRTQRIFEIDTDVMYQWRGFKTYETRITRIDGIHIKNIECDQADAIVEIKGDENFPVRNVNLENIRVGTVKKFISKIENAENVIQTNVTWNELEENEKQYVFSYFKGNSADGLHLAGSVDGLKWTAFKNDESFLKPEVAEDKLMRDPCIIEGPDGKFHLVWTVSWADKGIGYACSTDLMNWSEQKYIPVMAHEEGARNCWAPEITFDPENGEYMIYWATTIVGRFDETACELENGYNHRMYYVTTKDFETFGETKLLYDPGFNVIDATIVKDNKRWIMFMKDETREPAQKNLKIAYSDKLTGPYSAASKPVTGDCWVEGPTAVKIGNEWIVYFDMYRDKRFGAISSSDLETWKDISDSISLPQGIRHGSILEVKKELFERLRNL